MGEILILLLNTLNGVIYANVAYVAEVAAECYVCVLSLTRFG